MENSIVIIFNGIGMLFCFGVGLRIAYWGYNIYSNDKQSSNDKQHIKWGSLTISSKGSGSIVITSAVAWAIVGLYVSPSITQTEYGPNYTSIINNKNEEFMIVSHAINNPTEALDQPDILTKYLSNELASDENNLELIKINGLSGQIDGEATNYYVDKSGNITLTAPATGEFGNVMVWFEPYINNEGNLVFKVSGVANKINEEPKASLEKH